MEQLEVEDDEQRQRRIHDHLERLNTSSSTKIRSSWLKLDFDDRRTSLPVPPTELLARVQAFLPQIQASNVVLAQQAKADPRSVDMEHLDDGVEEYIEMKLGLGVFEDKSKKRTSGGDSDGNDVELPSGARSSTFSSSSDSSLDDNDEDGYGSESSSADTEFSSEIITSFTAAPRLIRPLPKRSPASRLKKPTIQVLGENV